MKLIQFIGSILDLLLVWHSPGFILKLEMWQKKWFHWEISLPQNFEIPKLIAHIHIPRNTPAKVLKYLMNSLGGVADKGPLYMYMKEIV